MSSIFSPDDSLGAQSDLVQAKYLRDIQEQNWEHQYLNLIEEILNCGDDRVDRTGVGTRAIFGKTLDIDLKQGFPAITTKKLAWKAVVSELLWFLEGSPDERRLAEILHGTRDPAKKTIWTENAEADYWKPKAKFDGDLGPVYGVQWRGWKTYEDAGGDKLDGGLWAPGPKIDQVADVIKKLKTNPTDRRMIISAWNVADLNSVALPPCHMMAQFFVRKLTLDELNNSYLEKRSTLDVETKASWDAKYEGQAKTEDVLKAVGLPTKALTCQMYQRSVDTMLGLPFNIASYALLTHMIAHVTGLAVDRLVMNLGDTHIYANHLEGAKEQLLRIPTIDPVGLKLNAQVTDIDGFKLDDFELVGYHPLPSIKLQMAV